VVVTKSRTVALRVQSTRQGRVTAVLLSPRGARVHTWRFGVRAGAAITRVRLPLLRTPGRYRIAFTATSGGQTVRRTIVVQVAMRGSTTTFTVPRRPVEIVLAGGSSIEREVARALGTSVRLSAADTGDDAWLLTGNASRNVQVVVVDVDRFGIAMVRDLRTVFPTVKILALTNDPRRLAQAVRAGATLAVPRTTRPTDIAKLIRQLAARR
jgi:hypothetical protein